MKFQSDQDKILFLSEVGRVDLFEGQAEIPAEVIDEFIKRRREKVFQLKDFRRSQLSKRAWRVNRFSMMKGINKFHRSVKGKKFHRQLGRFLATRVFEVGDYNPIEVVKAISSAKTHLLLEFDYFMGFDEELELHNLIEYAIPLLSEIETKVIEESPEALSADHYELLARLCDPVILKEESGKDLDESFSSDNTYGLLEYYSSITNLSWLDFTVKDTD